MQALKRTKIRKVPNVPCGVERDTNIQRRTDVVDSVPNVPCGVERKYFFALIQLGLRTVPNVPCGVERSGISFMLKVFSSWFLMYRVELKDTKTPLPATALPLFLMYRVELKVLTPPQ